ncbi:MAG: lasso peptide biosynthesis B2 protein [Pseudomonadota bacterium]
MLSRYRQLSPEERADLFPATFRLLIVQCLILFGIQRTASWLGTLGSARPSELNVEAWTRRSRALSRTSRLIPGARCLSRAMALRWWMRQSGIPAELVIGAGSGPTGLRSHAWVEANGQRFDTGEAQPLTEIQRY